MVKKKGGVLAWLAEQIRFSLHLFTILLFLNTTREAQVECRSYGCVQRKKCSERENFTRCTCLILLCPHLHWNIYCIRIANEHQGRLPASSNQVLSQYRIFKQQTDTSTAHPLCQTKTLVNGLGGRCKLSRPTGDGAKRFVTLSIVEPSKYCGRAQPHPATTNKLPVTMQIFVKTLTGE